MKKIVIILLLTVSAIAASAQFRYAATVGVDVSSLKFKQDLFEINQNVGGSAGVMAEMMFPGIGFGIDFGLLYEMRGANLHLGDREIWRSQGYGTERLTLHYIDIPLHLRFKWTRMNGVEDIVAPFVYGGPSFSFLAGHSKLDMMDFAAGEVGLGCGLGAELFKKWQISAGYTWGMTYACKTKLLTNFSAQNRTWDIRVAYFF